MSLRRSQLLLLASTVLLAVVAAAWWAWPTTPERADLEAVAPISTSTTPTTTTAPASTTEAPAAPTSTTTTTSPPPAPVRLRIPAIGVDASVVPVGLAADGQMEVPPAADVGWYRLGPTPGQPGSAVLAAHVDSGGQRGAFFDLRAVPIGAEVFVDDGQATRRYLVFARTQLAKDQIDLAPYFTHQGDARLTLITCGGAFDEASRHYTDNIVVTAVPA